jgi:hypothetical protein
VLAWGRLSVTAKPYIYDQRRDSAGLGRIHRNQMSCYENPENTMITKIMVMLVTLIVIWRIEEIELLAEETNEEPCPRAAKESSEKLEEPVGTALELEVTLTQSAALEPALKVEVEMMLLAVAVEAWHSPGLAVLAGKAEGSSFHKTAITSLNSIL